MYPINSNTRCDICRFLKYIEIIFLVMFLYFTYMFCNVDLFLKAGTLTVNMIILRSG